MILNSRKLLQSMSAIKIYMLLKMLAGPIISNWKSYIEC